METNIPNELQSKIDEYQIRETSAYFRNRLTGLIQRGDLNELKESFTESLEFGTGGIRGIIGPGTNRLNNCIVEGIADGWGRYLISQYGDKAKVVVAYDSRHFSQEFAHTLTEVLVAKGITVYCYPHPRPTPQLSYTIRQIKAHSGAVITASHNPPQYNGIKIYWSEGQQVVPPHDNEIIKCISESVYPITRLPLDICRQRGLLIDMGDAEDSLFRDYVCSQVNTTFLKEHSSLLKIVYTPLHGTGNAHMHALATRCKLNLIAEPSQSEPDGDFPTVAFPNPEDPKALVNALETAKKAQADIVIATDPDADRVGIASRLGDDFVLLTGNQIGALLLDFIIRKKNIKKTAESALGTRTDLIYTPYFINTIVTSELQDRIAQAAGVEVVKTFTGFKNIATAIEEKGTEGFVFSGEESYGYLPDTRVRDKDGISSALLIIELAMSLKNKGIGLLDQLETLYKTHGYHQEHTINGVFEGVEGKKRINDIMIQLRHSPPSTFATQAVLGISDFLKGSMVDTRTGEQTDLSMPKGNVLIFHLEGDNKLCVRPSGTEPKIKFYLLFRAKRDDADLAVQRIEVGKRIEKGTREVEQWIA